MVSQAGFENVVATSGTALTPYQLKILKRYSENLLTAFDMDPAGDSATKRGIDLAQSQGFNVKVIMMPENFDPADLIAKDAKKWESLVNNSKSILEFYFDTTFSRFDKNFPENKKTIAQILLPKIKTIPNKIEQSFWIQKLAKELEVKEAVIEEELKKIKIEPPPLSAESEIEIMTDISFSEIKKKKDRRELLEERLIILTLKEPENINFLDEKDFQFLSPPFKEILTFFKEKFSPQELKEKREKLGEIFQKEESFPLEIKDLINYLSLKAEVEQEEEKFEKVLEKNFFQEEFQNCLKEIKFLNIKNKLDEISLAIKKAEEEKDILRVKKLLAEFDFYSKTLNILR
jgi:DNA primase